MPRFIYELVATDNATGREAYNIVDTDDRYNKDKPDHKEVHLRVGLASAMTITELLNKEWQAFLSNPW